MSIPWPLLREPVLLLTGPPCLGDHFSQDTKGHLLLGSSAGTRDLLHGGKLGRDPEPLLTLLKKGSVSFLTQHQSQTHQLSSSAAYSTLIRQDRCLAQCVVQSVNGSYCLYEFCCCFYCYHNTCNTLVLFMDFHVNL